MSSIQIPALHPGSPDGYLTSATIFWDYFQFDAALKQIADARTRFAQPSLFAYEAGAIDENRHDLLAAVEEYVDGVLRPLPLALRVDAGAGFVEAEVNAPSDAADSNVQSTLQSFIGSPEARQRLLELSTRAASGSMVDQATAKAVALAPADAAALVLRADILTEQHRERELAPLLSAALMNASTQAQAVAIGSLAQAHGLAPVYERALARQAEVTPDPVERMELEYSEARSLEARQQVSAAQAIIDRVYAANPLILGVIRGTVDFDVRTHHLTAAVATLLQAASVATPKLARDFTLEAANRANDSGATAQGRSLALGLLSANPYDAQALALDAASYSRKNDDAGLKTFYLNRLDSARMDPSITVDTRRENVALLRRGLIPALTRLGDFAGAEDQYIALLSAFPEDAGTANQAIQYAMERGRQEQLASFLETTVKQSPRDSRFAILLGQADVAFGNLPAALAAYDQAISVRQDRVDLYQARAALELQLASLNAGPAPAPETLLDRAADDFARLYQLSYQDPQYQVSVAEVRARQGRTQAVVAALETAYVAGRPTTGPVAAAAAFKVAAKLEGWNLLPQARIWAEKGVALAGADLLLAPASASDAAGANPPSFGPVVYARVLTRLGQPEVALQTLDDACQAAVSTASTDAALKAWLPPVAAGDDHTGTDAQALRDEFVRTRKASAAHNRDAAVNALGAAAGKYLTPEQRLSFAAALDTLHAVNPELALRAATATPGLQTREAAWRAQALLVNAPDASTLAAYTTLERQRLQFAELGHTLEAYAQHVKPEERAGIRRTAAESYRDAGDAADELRLTRSLALAGDPTLRDRFFDLLLRHNPAALSALVSGSDATLADAAINYTLAHGDEAQTLGAVDARAQALPPVWRPASLALTGVYFAGSPSAAAHVAPTLTAFEDALGNERTIAERIAQPANPTHQLVGAVWFPYAASYGIFLQRVQAAASTTNAPLAEDFLPAELELAPSDPSSYTQLAQTYTEANDTVAALAEYAHVFELAPDGDQALLAYDARGVLLMAAGQTAQAATSWRAGLRMIQALGVRNTYLERFFTSFASILHHAAQAHVDLTVEAEVILRQYLAHNGNYRSNELLEAAYRASPTPSAGAALLTSVAQAAANPLAVLDDLRRAGVLTTEADELVLKREVELAQIQNSAQTPPTPSGTSASYYQDILLRLYLDRNQMPQAEALATSLESANTTSASLDSGSTKSVSEAQIEVAVRSGKLELLLTLWRSGFSTPSQSDFQAKPSVSTLDAALYHLRQSTPEYTPMPRVIRPLLEYDFARKQESGTLATSDFLAQAQNDLDTGDVPGAVSTLRRLTLEAPTPSQTSLVQTGLLQVAEPRTGLPDPYVNLDDAAQLLEASHHPAEAIPFLQPLAASVPWNAEYRLRLAQAQLAAGAGARLAAHALTALAGDATAPYATRVESVRTLAENGIADGSAGFGSSELTLLASPHPTTAQARQPGLFSAQAFVAEAAGTPDADRVALLHEILSADPAGLNAERLRISLLLAEAGPGNDAAAPDEAGLIRLLRETPPSTPQNDAPYDSATDQQEPGEPSFPGSEPQEPPVSQYGEPFLAIPDHNTRIRVAEIFSASAERDHDLSQAILYLQVAVTLNQVSLHPDSSITMRLRILKAQAALEARNRTRQPVFKAELAQPNVVRPRLAPARAVPEQEMP
jgi:hypothetical protein